MTTFLRMYLNGSRNGGLITLHLKSTGKLGKRLPTIKLLQTGGARTVLVHNCISDKLLTGLIRNRKINRGKVPMKLFARLNSTEITPRFQGACSSAPNLCAKIRWSFMKNCKNVITVIRPLLLQTKELIPFCHRSQQMLK